MIRSRPAGFLLALVVLAACSSPPPPPPPRPEEVGVVRVPLVLEDGLPWVRASIQGQPVQLLLDLGGFDAVALTSESLSELEVNWTGRSKFTFSAMGESARAKEYVVRDFVLAGIRFPEVRGYEDLLHGKHRSQPRSGYLGLGVLRRFRIIIDYEAGRLVLIWPDAPMPAGYDVENWATLEFKDNPDGVMARVKLDGKERILVWDTGASHCVLKKGLEGAAPVSVKNGHPFARMESFEVAGREAGPMDFALLAFSEPKADGFVGTPFFARHAVYIDFANRVMAVRP